MPLKTPWQVKTIFLGFFIGGLLIVVGATLIATIDMRPFIEPNKNLSPTDKIIGTVAMTFLCCIFLSFGGIPTFLRIREIQKAKQIIANGLLQKAHPISVEKSENISISGAHPYRLIVQWSKGGKKYQCKSERIWFDPTDYLQKNQEIDVYEDSFDPKKSFVDVSFLAEAIKEH